ncbi:MAG: hypothetical protein LV473_10930 [Nitrospira sp.]|nr:hypothetical protein [Nitrospira sp.]
MGGGLDGQAFPAAPRHVAQEGEKPSPPLTPLEEPPVAPSLPLPATSTERISVSPLLSLTAIAMLAVPLAVSSLPITTRPETVIGVLIPLALMAGVPDAGPACTIVRYCRSVSPSNRQLPYRLTASRNVIVAVVGYRPCRTNTPQPAAAQLLMPCWMVLQALPVVAPQKDPSAPSAFTYTTLFNPDRSAPAHTAAGVDGASVPPTTGPGWLVAEAPAQAARRQIRPMPIIVARPAPPHAVRPRRLVVEDWLIEDWFIMARPCFVVMVTPHLRLVKPIPPMSR